jgi:hypothetical protein
MEEEIKQIKAYPDYYVSNLGIAYTTKISKRYNPKGEMRVLQPRRHPSGYLYFGFFVGNGPNKKRIWRRAHRVVFETFVSKIKHGLEIDHIDGNKHNNNVTNLRLLTHAENCQSFWNKKLGKICA